MSIMMEEEINRWTAKRKTALVMDIIQGKTTVSEAARAFDLAPSEIEEWLMTPNRAWRTLCAPNRWISASNSKSFRRPMAKPCWSYAPE